MEIGVVDWFDVKRGYGFIKRNDGKDLFVHFSKIVSDEGHFRLLESGDSVEFEIQAIDGARPQAINVRIVDEIFSKSRNDSVRGRSQRPENNSIPRSAHDSGIRYGDRTERRRRTDGDNTDRNGRLRNCDGENYNR